MISIINVSVHLNHIKQFDKLLSDLSVDTDTDTNFKVGYVYNHITLAMNSY